MSPEKSASGAGEQGKTLRVQGAEKLSGRKEAPLASARVLLAIEFDRIMRELENETRDLHDLPDNPYSIRYTIGLPSDVMKVLEWHTKRLTGRRKDSELLFPSRVAGFMSRSALDKPFALVSEQVGLPFHFTPRGMRRTYQDIGRGEKIEQKVRKAVCGHATDKMSGHDSTVRPDEMRTELAKITRAVTRPKRVA